MSEQEIPLAGTPSFDYRPRTRVVFGEGALDRLGELAREAGGTSALVVTDPGIVKAGHVERAARLLADAGLSASVFDGVRENPTTLDVDRCVRAAREARADMLIGLGGGSSIDAAKGANFLLTNGGRMADYWGHGLAARPMLPLIAVPTTAGTGSEVQSYTLIAEEETHRKMACGDPRAAPVAAVLDPLLTVSQPRGVTACTGMDAIVHSVEATVTRRRNPLSSLFAREAFRRLIHAFPVMLERPDDLPARGEMLLGAAYAGMAIENSMLGAAHSAANPLTARFNVVHGQAVGLMLPHVIRFNAEDAATQSLYADLLIAAGLPVGSDPAEALAAIVCERLDAAGHAVPLSALGVTEADVPILAEEAAVQWTARFNPRAVTAEDFVRLYSAAL